MIKLRFRLLGEPEIWYGPTRLHTRLSRKQLALLIFLVCEGTVFRRERLATLLWGRCAQSNALYNLRRAIYEIGKVITSIGLDKATFLAVDSDAVRFLPDAPYWLDVQAFKAGAVDLYGPFLGTFTVNNAPEFEEWQTVERAAIDLMPGSIRKMTVNNGVIKVLLGHRYIGPTGEWLKLVCALASDPLTLVFEHQDGRTIDVPESLFRAWFTAGAGCR